MTLKAKTKLGGTKGRIYIYIPRDVVVDSLFPFKIGDKVVIRIDKKNKRLIIEGE